MEYITIPFLILITFLIASINENIGKIVKQLEYIRDETIQITKSEKQ